jgi:hypothetical protein
MSDTTLVDGFWHPKLGLVLSYLFVLDRGTVTMPRSGRAYQMRYVERLNIALSHVTEEGAPYALECARQLGWEDV